MTTFKTTHRKSVAKSWRLHRKLAYLAAIATILWAASGLLHPALNFMRDTPVTFRPQPMQLTAPMPKTLLSPAQLTITPPALTLSRTSKFDLANPVQQVQLMGDQGEIAYQVTLANNSERLYFDARTGNHLPEADWAWAANAATHYTGKPISEQALSAAKLYTDFSLEYPPINKFLPAWAIRYQDGLTAVVETEGGQLVRLTNDTRQVLQNIFQIVHTLPFLPEIVRVPVLTMLMLAVFAMACAGVVLLLRWPKKRGGLYRVHRVLAWVVLLPVLTYPISGVFHLWVYAEGMTSAEKTIVQKPGIDVKMLGVAPALGAKTVVIDDTVYWRSVAVKNGRPQPAQWYSAAGVLQPAITDAAIAKRIMKTDQEPSLITGFSAEYGFANRILPVWRVAANGLVHFIDVSRGDIVTSIDGLDTAELWSFNHLHKWKFANEWLGKLAGNRFMGMALRDGVQIFLTGLIVVLAVTGLVMRRRRSQ